MRKRKPEYIINLAQHLIGLANLSRLEHGNQVMEPKSFFASHESLVTPKIKVMSDESLGRICGYAETKPLGQMPRPTTLAEVLGEGELTLQMTGREILERMAIATVICVAFDTVKRAQSLRAQDRQHECFVLSGLKFGK